MNSENNKVTPHFSQNTSLHPPGKSEGMGIPPLKGVRGMSAPQNTNSTHEKSYYPTILHILVQTNIFGVHGVYTT